MIIDQILINSRSFQFKLTKTFLILAIYRFIKLLYLKIITSIIILFSLLSILRSYLIPMRSIPRIVKKMEKKQQKMVVIEFVCSIFQIEFAIFQMEIVLFHYLKKILIKESYKRILI